MESTGSVTQIELLSCTAWSEKTQNGFWRVKVGLGGTLLGGSTIQFIWAFFGVRVSE
jgi:hypothetical protein